MFVKYNGMIAKKESDQEVTVMDLERLELLKVSAHPRQLSETEAKEMSCEEFYDFLSNSYFFDVMYQEMKQLDEISTEKVLKVMVEEATDKHVFLYDLNDFDYDKFLHKEIKDFRL